MNDTSGYIVEFMHSNGELEILHRDYQQYELTIIKTKLDQHPIVKKETPGIKLQYEMDKATNQAIYRYKGKRDIRPHWINVVILPDAYLYITYSANLPILKPNWKSHSGDFLSHIGTSFYLTTENKLCFFYVNPNVAGLVTTLMQIDIAHSKRMQKSTFSSGQLLYHDHPNLIDKAIAQAVADRKDSKITQQKIDLSRQQDVVCHFHLAKPKNLIKALRKIDYIKVATAGGHQHKATNIKTNRSAPIPWHKELDHNFPCKLAKQLGIPYDVLLEAAR